MTFVPVNPTDLGSYNIVVQATVSAPVSAFNMDPAYANRYTLDVFTFTLDVVDDCYIDPVPSTTLLDIFYLIDGLNTLQMYAVPTYVIEPPCNT